MLSSITSFNRKSLLLRPHLVHHLLPLHLFHQPTQPLTQHKHYLNLPSPLHPTHLNFQHYNLHSHLQLLQLLLPLLLLLLSLLLPQLLLLPLLLQLLPLLLISLLLPWPYLLLPQNFCKDPVCKLLYINIFRQPFRIFTAIKMKNNH